jgi:cytochrome d ubiquinol oxidase subunit II
VPWPEAQNALAFANGAVLLLGVVLYALFGGADFGGGVWDLLAGGPRAAQQRQVIAHAIGPIWEANHVWLIFVIVLVFTVFPPVFAALSIALYIPFSLALLGIVFRGAAFIFRTPARPVAGIGAWDRGLALASTVTPGKFGMAAGAVASGQIRIVSGFPVSDPWRTWLAPFPFVIGLLALTTCAYLAAVYLTLETTGELQEDFRRRALGAGIVFALLAAVAFLLARTEAPWIWHGLTSRVALIGVPAGIALALLSGWAVFQRRYRLARIAAAGEVVLLLGGWALAQYPYLVVPDLTFENAAASPAMMRAALVVFGIGALFLIPSLWFLFSVFKADLPGAAEVGTGAATQER